MKRREFLSRAAMAVVAAPFLALGANRNTEPYLTVWYGSEPYTLPPVSKAVYNPVTGRNEITVELPFFPDDITSNWKFNLSEEPAPELVCELIVIVITIVVLGVIYTYLVKTCKRWLPPSNPTNS